MQRRVLRRQHQRSPETLNPRQLRRGVRQASFEDPEHKYHSVEITANKTFSDNWSLMASYRWAKLKGNFEGFFRTDNGQSDPAISSLFDFPTNDPSYPRSACRSSATAATSGTRAHARLRAVLPNDRPHQVKMYGNYAWGDLNLGARLQRGLGPHADRRWPPTRPTTTAARSRRPCAARASQTVDGFLERDADGGPGGPARGLHAQARRPPAGRSCSPTSSTCSTTRTDWTTTTTRETISGGQNPNFGT